MRTLPLNLGAPSLAALALGLCACSAEGPATEPAAQARAAGGIVRLPWAARGSWREVETIALLTPSREGSGWDAQARFHQILTVPESVDPDLPLAMYAYGPGTRMIKVPGPHDPGAFDRVRISFLADQSTQLRLILLRGGLPVLASAELQVQGSDNLQSLEFPMAMLHGITEPFEDLLLRVTGPGHAALVSVELQSLPAEAWLPHPDEGPLPVAVGGESRAALGLCPDGSLAGRGRGAPGARFVFACAVPPEVPGGTGASLLRVRLLPDGPDVSPGGSSDSAMEIEIPLRGGQPWTVQEVPAAILSLAESHFTYTITMEAGPGGPQACAITPPILARRREDAPTVILITSDTHRADHLGLAGRGVTVRTPHLDGLTRRGTLFEDCYASTNVTNPSHVALLTGTHPRDTGIVDNRTPLAEAAPTLAEAFRAAGYTTSMAVSATHLAPPHSGLGQGFDRIAFPEDADRDGEATLAALEPWWEEARGQPLFLWLHLFDAHAPYEVPDQDLADYYPPTRDPYGKALPQPASHMRPSWDREIRDLEQLDARYRAEVTYLDRLLGGLLARPRVAAGWLAFTADHGESLGNHGVYWDHRELYPDTLAVPLILTGPGVPAGARRSDPVQHRDLGRTLLDLAGLGSAAFPGRTLVGPERTGPRFALSANGTSASVALDGWFLVLHLMEHTLHADLPRMARHRVELYRTAEDRDCLEDLVRADPQRAGALRRLLVGWLQVPRSTGWVREGGALGTAHLADLDALGYTGAVEATSEWFDSDCTCPWCARF